MPGQEIKAALNQAGRSMNVLGNGLRRNLSHRYLSLIAAMTGLLAVGFGPTVAPAAAETPAHTDVLLVFDTSGSMEGQLQEAKQEIQEVIAHVNATLPDVEYGVAEVKDFANAYGERAGRNPLETRSGSDLKRRSYLQRDRTAESVRRR